MTLSENQVLKMGNAADDRTDLQCIDSDAVEEHLRFLQAEETHQALG